MQKHDPVHETVEEHANEDRSKELRWDGRSVFVRTRDTDVRANNLESPPWT